MPPATRSAALLIIDMINRLDFASGPALLRLAVPAARRIAALKRRFVAVGAPVIYANDNFGQWHADFRELVAVCRQPDCIGAPLAELLAPQPDDYYVLKPKHSAFHSTPLAVLLEQCGIERVVIGGVSTDVCIAATAIDAHMRELAVHVPSDCVAAPTRARSERALKLLRDSIGAATAAARWVRP